jgi:mono/diheme cytochrome c family protein
MRHFLANILTYAIAAFLFLGAAAFAWMRTAQLTIITEPDVVVRYAPGDASFQWQDLGAGSYRRNCANCHGRAGGGWDEYPAVDLAGEMLRTPDGREYLIDLHLYGLTSNRWGAPMPPMRHIHDVELAAVINYIATRFGNAPGEDLLVPDDVAARRGLGLSPAAVERRGRPVAAPVQR